MRGSALVERAEEWRRLRAGALVDVVVSPRQLVLRYERTTATETELERLVAAEQVCCAAEFVVWELQRGPDVVTLTVTFDDDYAASAEAGLVGDVIAGPSPR